MIRVKGVYLEHPSKVQWATPTFPLSNNTLLSVLSVLYRSSKEKNASVAHNNLIMGENSFTRVQLELTSFL